MGIIWEVGKRNSRVRKGIPRGSSRGIRHCHCKTRRRFDNWDFEAICKGVGQIGGSQNLIAADMTPY